MYTSSREADKQVERDLSIIKQIIFKHFNPSHIILFGSFGHNSGSFKKIKGKILPLNDYDFYLISKNRIPDQKLEQIGMLCSRALNREGIEFVENFSQKYDENRHFHVDLHSLTYNQLAKLYPTQRTFDLKTSLVIHGSKNILSLIPEIKISKSDALRLLFNKIDHFAIAENNSEVIKQIYAVKGLTDLCSAILIFEGKYVSNYRERLKVFKTLNVPNELKSLVETATKAKLDNGYAVKNQDNFFTESKKWVEWAVKLLLKKYLKIKSGSWLKICSIAYKKLPYLYFNDYLKNPLLFPAQYYLNIKFFLTALRKQEFLPKVLLNWRDSGITIALALILYSLGFSQHAEKYLRKLTFKTKPLRDRILRLYSIYYLQKLI